MNDEKLEFDAKIIRITPKGETLSYSEWLESSEPTYPTWVVDDISFSGKEFLFILNKLFDSCKAIDELREELKSQQESIRTLYKFIGENCKNNACPAPGSWNRETDRFDDFSDPMGRK